MTVKVGAADGAYRGMPRRRAYEIRVHPGGGEPAEVERTKHLRTDRATRIRVDLRG